MSQELPKECTEPDLNNDQSDEGVRDRFFSEVDINFSANQPTNLERAIAGDLGASFTGFINTVFATPSSAPFPVKLVIWLVELCVLGTVVVYALPFALVIGVFYIIYKIIAAIVSDLSE